MIRRFYVRVEITEYLDGGASTTATAVVSREVTVKRADGQKPTRENIEGPLADAARDAALDALRHEGLRGTPRKD